MREITSHRVNPANDTLTIEVTDAPGAGGAHHRYVICGFNTGTNPSADEHDDLGGISIVFQNGPIPEAGVNGVTQEALAAIVIDRLESFQAGPFACEENARALAAFKEGLHWLLHRTLKRMARGVEGTHTK